MFNLCFSCSNFKCFYGGENLFIPTVKLRVRNSEKERYPCVYKTFLPYKMHTKRWIKGNKWNNTGIKYTSSVVVVNNFL